MTPAHIPHHELAAFIDGECDGADHDRIRAHLDKCPDCYAAYQAAVRALGTRNGDEFSRLPDGVAARVMAIVHRRPGTTGGGRPFPRRGLIGILAAAAMVVVSITIWNVDRGSFDPQAPEFAPITASMAGYGGKLVFPGTEQMLAADQPVYRSLAPPDVPGVHESLEQLFDRFRRAETSVDEIYWLAAGYAALGEGGLAREVIMVSRSRSLDDPRFDVIEAIIAYRNSDLEHARDKLESAVGAMPGSAEAHFDLAVVLNELGLEDLAREHRTRARKLARGSALATRDL